MVILLYIDEFVDGKIAIRILRNNPGDVQWLNGLSRLESEIDNAAGFHPHNGSFSGGFMEYCFRQIDFVKRDRNASGVEIVLDNRRGSFSYMPIDSTAYWTAIGVQVVNLADVLEELGETILGSEIGLDEFEEIF